MRKRATAMLLCTAMLTGCALGGSAETLLAPPVIYEEQENIHNALIKCTGENITLEYPRSGVYRSAYVIKDIDDTEGDEAIVFYNLRDKLRVNILDKNDEGEWFSICDFEGNGTSVDRVIISNFGSADRTSIIIGYGGSGTDTALRVYSCSDGIVTENYADSCSGFFLYDLDNNGTEALCVIRGNNENIGKKAEFSVVIDDGSTVRIADTVRLNNKTSEFSAITLGNVGENTPAVFIDGLSDGQLSTEIVYQVGQTLRNPLYIDEQQKITDTLRSKGYYSSDIDLDGIVEIPTLSYFPGYNQDSRDSFYVTNWNVYSNFTVTKKYTSYYDLSKSYCFIIPARWDGLVTVKRDENNGDIVFYKYFIDLYNSTEELMRISAVSSEYYDEKIEKGYVLLKSRDNMNYFYKIPENSDEPLILTSTEIVNSFCLT